MQEAPALPEDDPRRDRDPREPVQPPAEDDPEQPVPEAPFEEPEDAPGRGEPERRDPGAGRPLKLREKEASW